MNYIRVTLLSVTNKSDQTTVLLGESRTVFNDSPTCFGPAGSLSRALSYVLFMTNGLWLTTLCRRPTKDYWGVSQQRSILVGFYLCEFLETI
jgi:hypothetical protein